MRWWYHTAAAARSYHCAVRSSAARLLLDCREWCDASVAELATWHSSSRNSRTAVSLTLQCHTPAHSGLSATEKISDRRSTAILTFELTHYYRQCRTLPLWLVQHECVPTDKLVVLVVVQSTGSKERIGARAFSVTIVVTRKNVQTCCDPATPTPPLTSVNECCTKVQRLRRPNVVVSPRLTNMNCCENHRSNDGGPVRDTSALESA